MATMDCLNGLKNGATIDFRGVAHNADNNEILQFRWSTTSGGPYTNVVPAIESPGDGSINQAMSSGFVTGGFQPNTTYYYVAEALDGAISTISDECSVTTDSFDLAEVVQFRKDRTSTRNTFHTTESPTVEFDILLRMNGVGDMPNTLSITDALPTGFTVNRTWEVTSVGAEFSGITQGQTGTGAINITGIGYTFISASNVATIIIHVVDVISSGDLGAYTNTANYDAPDAIEVAGTSSDGGSVFFYDMSCGSASGITSNSATITPARSGIQSPPTTRIYRYGTTQGGPYTESVTTDVFETSTEFTGLTPNTQYYYVVENRQSASGDIMSTTDECTFTTLEDAGVITSTKVTQAGPYTVGQPITSTVTITHTSGGAVTNYNVSDPIPATPVGTTRSFTSVATGGATGNTPSGTTDINDNLDLPVGSSVTYTIIDTPTQTGSYQNTLVTTPDGGPSNPPIDGGPPTPVDPPSGITVTKTTPAGPYYTGDVITSTLTLTNTTAGVINNYTISDPIPATPVGTTRAYTSVATGGATGNTASGTTDINDTIDFPANSTVTYTINDTVNGTGDYQNTAVGNYDGQPPLPPIDGGPPENITPNVIVTKTTAAGPFTVGQPITSTVTVSNIGTADSTGYIVTDVIPASPVGTTRTFTSVANGGATGNTASGTTDIVDTVDLPAGSSIVYTINDTPTAEGTYQNSVTIKPPNGPTEPPVTGGPPTDVDPPSEDDVTLTKVTETGPHTIGQPITSTVTVTNNGTTAVPSYTVSDPIPAIPTGTTRSFTSVANGGATGNTASGTTDINDTLVLPVGASVVYTINDTVTQTGQYQNAVVGTNNGFPPNTETGGPPTDVNPPSGIEVVKTTPVGPYYTGDTITSTLTLTNTTSSPINGYTISDPIPSTPSGTTRMFTSVETGGATGNTASGTTDILDTIDFPANATVTYTINDTVNDTGSYQNSAVGNYDGQPPLPPEVGGPPETITPNVVLTKVTEAGPFTVGQPIQSTVTVSNLGTAASSGYILSDPIPATPTGTTRSFTSIANGGATGNTASGTTDINDTLDLPAGSSVVYTVNDTPTQEGTYQNSATIQPPNGPAEPPITGGPPTDVNPPLGDEVTLTKVTAAGPHVVGTPIQSTVTVTNNGSVDVPVYTLSDPIPATPTGTTRTYTSTASGGATGNTASGTTDINDTLNLPIGSSVVYTINDTVTQAGQYQNTVTGTNNGFPPTIITGGPPTDVEPPFDQSDIVVTKVTSPPPYTVGQPITSTVTVTNTGTATHTNYNVSDPIPVTPLGTTRTFTSTATGGATGNTPSGTTSISDNLTLPPNSVVTYTINDTPTQTGTYQNRVTTTPDGGPPNPPIDGGPPTPVDPVPANITVTKTTPAGPYNIGDVVTSTVTVSNSGGVAGTTTLTDPIPATPTGTTRTYTSIVTGGATGNTPSGTTGITDNLSLPANSTVVYTINDTVTSAGSYQNTATITGEPPVTGGPPEEITPKFTYTKVTQTGTYYVGDPIVSTVTVKNISTTSGTTTITDPIPATPAGTNRVFTSTTTGTVTGNTAYGTTGINDTVTMSAGAEVVYTITDTMSNEGSYENTVSITGQPPISGGGPFPIDPTPQPPVLADLCRTDVVKICTTSSPVKLCNNNVPILLHVVTASEGDVIPVTSTEFPAGENMGVFTTIGFVRSYYTNLRGEVLAVQPTNPTAKCDDKALDAEIVCLVPNGSPQGTDPIMGLVVYDLTVDPPVGHYFIGTTNVDATHTQVACTSNKDYEQRESCYQNQLDPTQRHTRIDWFDEDNFSVPIQTVWFNQTSGTYGLTAPANVVPCQQVQIGLGNDVTLGCVNGVTWEHRRFAYYDMTTGQQLVVVEGFFDQNGVEQATRPVGWVNGECRCNTTHHIEKLVDRREEITALRAVYVNTATQTIEHRELINNTVLYTGPTGYSAAPSGAYDVDTSTYYNFTQTGGLMRWDLNDLSAGGTPIPLSGATIPTGANFGAYDPTTGLIHVGRDTTDRRTVNPTTGLVTTVPPISNVLQSVSSAAITRDGRMWAITYPPMVGGTTRFYEVNKGTGVATFKGAFPANITQLNGLGSDNSAEQLGWVAVNAANLSIYRWTQENASDATQVATGTSGGNTLDVVDIDVSRQDVCFFRTYNMDCAGNITGTQDFDAEGEPFTIEGTVISCANDNAQEIFDAEFVQLCDNGTPFLRRIITNTGTGEQVVRNFALNGVSPYTVSNETNVGNCNTGGTVDRELICYRTTANPSTQLAWARHDDTFVGVTGQNFIDGVGGIGYFTATVPAQPLNITQAGFEIINCNATTATASETDLVYSNAQEICVNNGGVLTSWLVRQAITVNNATGAAITTTTEYSSTGSTWVTAVPTGTITIGKCEQNVTTVNTTIGTLRATTGGTVAAAMQSVTFIGLSGVSSVNGTPINAGETKSFTGYFDNATNQFKRLPSIPYTTTGNLDIHWVV